ncbi:MAG: GDP-mannose 4,6-dehydratase [bacterium]|nr:GDP-mannose 4,6-dehydratase [bacterium]
MKTLITGGAGFIGSHLTEGLLNTGHQVDIIDDLSTGSMENIQHLVSEPKFKYIIDTIMDIKLMEKLVRKVDVVYHLAASVGVKYVIDNPLKSLETNIKGTEIVLDVANRKGKKMVILASTSEVYGKNDKVPLKEDDDRILGSTYIARWGYSDSKAIDELLAFAYYREKKLPIIIVRFFNICGPRQTGKYGMVLPRFVKSALLNHPITVYGDGNQTRCFCFVGDMVKALLILPHKPQAIGEVFNIGSNEEISIRKLAEKVKKIAKSSSSINFIPYDQAYEKGFEDMRRRVPDISKIRKLVGFKPKVKLDELIKKVIEYYEQ